MKVTLNWLKQYVDFNWSASELSERLTMLGLEVEGVETLGGGFEGIVVAQVLTRDKHPNADKLSLCRVLDGKGERQIVCGAQNFKPGDKVPLILPGASLPMKPGDKEPFTIKVGKIRGVESQGMMCSHEELGLDPVAIGHAKEDGLLILRPDAVVGQPFAAYLGRGETDIVYDLEVTPNRPDLNSVIGIAREIAALTGNPLRLPAVPVATGAVSEIGATPGASIDSYVAVELGEPGLCPRYTARVVTGVQVGPSPSWLRHALEKVGLRSINNVVDVTNFVMLEIGQPLHAFDYHLVAPSAAGKPTIVLRKAGAGERFVTLDGQERTLTPEMLLIADAQKGIALAGIMGGQNSEIRAETRDVLIESAYFQPANIRRTSKALGLRSESSYRFERGADFGAADWASRRCVQLILETAGGSLVAGAIDACPSPIVPKQIALRFEKTNALLGVRVAPDDQARFLTRLGLTEMADGATPLGKQFTVPTWRVDLKQEVDLIEEIARLFGVDAIPSTPPRGAIGSHPADAVYDLLGEARRLLSGLGLDEAQGQTLVARADLRGVGEAQIVALANPLSADMDVLRPSLLPGLLSVLRHNLTRKNSSLSLFEIGRVFGRPAANATAPVQEERRVAIALTGQRQLAFWSGEQRDARFDVHDLKGVLEEFLEQFGLRGVTYIRRPDPTALFVESAAIQLGGKLALGEFGQLLPALAKQLDLRDPVFLAELNLEQLLARRNGSKSFKPLPQFPTIRRDIAMFLPETATHDAVLQVVRQVKPANLEAVELFDVFRGPTVPAGQKSVAYAFTYRHAERTLTDVEVNGAHEKLVVQLKQTLQAVVRE